MFWKVWIGTVLNDEDVFLIMCPHFHLVLPRSNLVPLGGSQPLECDL